MDKASIPYELAFSGAISLLMIIFGWLLNRVFSELDKLKASDDKLSAQIHAMLPMMVDRTAFEKHIEREEEALLGLRKEMQALVLSINDLRIVIARNHLKE